MTAKTELFGSEWVQKELACYQEDINNRKTYVEIDKEATEKLQATIADIYDKHIPEKCKEKVKKSVENRREELRNERETTEKLLDIQNDTDEQISEDHKTKVKKSAEERREELRNDKNAFPQRWKLEGKNGVHEIMQRRSPSRIEAPIARDEIFRQEREDKNKMYPRKNGWGKYHNMTYEQFSEHFFETCVNNLFEIAEWMDNHPDHPMYEYYNNLFQKRALPSE